MQKQEKERNYTIEVTETLTKEVVVKATSPDLALEKIKKSYSNEEFVLDSSDYITTDFSVKESKDKSKD